MEDDFYIEMEPCNPIRHFIVQSRKVLKPWDLYLDCTIALKFDRHLDSTAAEMPVKFQNDVII